MGEGRKEKGERREGTERMTEEKQERGGRKEGEMQTGKQRDKIFFRIVY